MTLLQGPGAGARRRPAPLRFAARDRAVRWSAGFGPAVDPYQANLTAVSERAARRRLRRCLVLHRDLLARTDAERASLARAVEVLDATGRGEPFAHQVTSGGAALTFWLLPTPQAERLGCRPKR